MQTLKYSPDEDLKRLFHFLDMKEWSEQGHEFHPVNISCCRVMYMEELNAILKRLKEYSNQVPA